MYRKVIKADAVANKSLSTIARKIFITYPTFAFRDNNDLEFEILNEVSEKFHVEITSIQVCGSAQVGESPFKDKLFDHGNSDLDLAIINKDLFVKALHFSNEGCDYFRDYSKFQKPQDDYIKQFQQYIARGIFRPDLMPFCPERVEWMTFFRQLSNKYNAHFSKISASIYLSSQFYEIKQIPALEQLKRKI